MVPNSAAQQCTLTPAGCLRPGRLQRASRGGALGDQGQPGLGERGHDAVLRNIFQPPTDCCPIHLHPRSRQPLGDLSLRLAGGVRPQARAPGTVRS